MLSRIRRKRNRGCQIWLWLPLFSLALCLLLILAGKNRRTEADPADVFHSEKEAEEAAVFYQFHRDCPCSRAGRSLAQLAEGRRRKLLLEGENYKIVGRAALGLGEFVGPSICNEFTTALGFGQRVVAYSFYEPSDPGLVGTPSFSIFMIIWKLVKHN